jgi:hypothetical protein
MSQSVQPRAAELRCLPNFYRWLGFCTSGSAGKWWRSETEWGDVVDPKLAMLIALFGVIITLSHLTADRIERLRERLVVRHRRKDAPVTDEI